MNEYVLTVLSTAIVYVFLLTAILIFGKKQLTQLSITDLVFLLLISNAVQNAMVEGNLKSLWMGILAAVTLFLMNYGVKSLVFKNAFIRKLIEGEAIVLIDEGEAVEGNIKREKITMKELEAAIHEHGVENISEVQKAVLEVDGNISVVSFNSDKKTIVRIKPRRIPAKIRRQD